MRFFSIFLIFRQKITVKALFLMKDAKNAKSQGAAQKDVKTAALPPCLSRRKQKTDEVAPDGGCAEVQLVSNCRSANTPYRPIPPRKIRRFS